MFRVRSSGSSYSSWSMPKPPARAEPRPTRALPYPSLALPEPCPTGRDSKIEEEELRTPNLPSSAQAW